MAEDPTSGLRILVTNDDGINAPGIRTLEQVARRLSEDVWVVAPETNQSGAAHSLTLQRPLRIRRLSERRFAVDGTPTDCVLVALQRIVEESVDLVLSGVNRGGNLAEDISYSGTVAAAIEATLFKIRAIAFSQVHQSRESVRWATAEHVAPDLVRRLIALDWSPEVLINVNFRTSRRTPSAACGSRARASARSATCWSSASTRAASLICGSGPCARKASSGPARTSRRSRRATSR